MYDEEDGEAGGEDEPEVLSRIGCLEDAQDEGGDEAEGVQVGHEAEHADEEAEGDGEREADDEESDTEKNAYAERNECLTAEVAVHAFGQVAEEGAEEGLLSLRYELHDAACEFFVVYKDEEKVEQADERRDDADDDAGGLIDHVPHPWCHFLDHTYEVFLVDEFVEVELAHLPVDEFFDLGRYAFVVAAVFNKFYDTLFEMVGFLDDGGHGEGAETVDDGAHEGEGDEDAQDAGSQMEFVLEKDDNGVEQVGREPCDEERREHGAQVVDEQNGGCDAGQYEQSAHEAVEGDFFFQHGA